MDGILFTRHGIKGNQIPLDISDDLRRLPVGTSVYFDSVRIRMPGNDTVTVAAVYHLFR